MVCAPLTSQPNKIKYDNRNKKSDEKSPGWDLNPQLNPTRVYCLWIFFHRTLDSTEYSVLNTHRLWVKHNYILYNKKLTSIKVSEAPNVKNNFVFTTIFFVD